VTRLQGENSRALAECGRLKEDNEKLARRQSELQDHANKMKEDLKSKQAIFVESEQRMQDREKKKQSHVTNRTLETS